MFLHSFHVLHALRMHEPHALHVRLTFSHISLQFLADKNVNLIGFEVVSDGSCQ